MLNALRTGNASEVDRLLTARPKLTAHTDRAGNTLLHLLADGEIDSKEIAEILLAHGVTDAHNKHGFMAIHRAALYKCIGIIQALLAASADVNAAEKGGTTPLHRAVYVGDIAIVALLLNAGANANAANNIGSTPLHWAASYPRRVEIARMLLEHGADKSLANMVGYTPLKTAKLFGRDDVARLLKGD